MNLLQNLIFTFCFFHPLFAELIVHKNAENLLSSIEILGHGKIVYLLDDKNSIKQVLRLSENNNLTYLIELVYDDQKKLIKELVKDCQGTLIAEHDFFSEESNPHFIFDENSSTLSGHDTPFFLEDKEKHVRYRVQKNEISESYWQVNGEEIAIFDSQNHLKELKIPGIKVLPQLTLPLIIEKEGKIFLPKLKRDLSITGLKDLYTKLVYLNPDIDPYGQILLKKKTLSSFSYRQKIYDEYTQTVYFGHRTYDVASKKWLSKDPLGPIQSEDLFLYCGGHPEQFIDPDGRFFFIIPLLPLSEDTVETLIQITKNLIISSIEDISKHVNHYLNERADRKKEEEFLEIQTGKKLPNQKSFFPDISPLDDE